MTAIDSCPVWNAEEVAARVRAIDVQGALRRAFSALAEGRATQPPQTLALLPQGAGDFITYLGVLADEGVFGAKLSPYLIGPAGGVVTAWTLLLSLTSGAPVLLCDAKQLTTLRTAATTALAVDLLAHAQARQLTVFGSGPVAQAHIREAAGLRRWSRIRVHSPGLLTSPARAQALRNIDPRVEVAPDATAALGDADVVMLCTSAATPVLDPAYLTRRAVITSISTNAPRAHEVPPASLADWDVYCDYRQTTPDAAGEMQLASTLHGWHRDRIRGDLPELVTGRCPLPTADRPTYFRSVGLGLEDVAIAQALRSAAIA